MKTIKKVLFVAMMLTIATSYAGENTNGVITNATKLLKFSNVKIGHQCKIIDENGTILYKEKIKQNGTFVKRFDFTALNDGSYTIELEKDFEIIVTPFIIQSNNVVFLDKEVKTVFKPLARTQEDQLLISHMSLDEEPLEIELYYNGERIFEDQLSGDKILTRVIKLSAKEKGDYHLNMTVGGRSYVKTFEL
jgi:hypothetical protein|nr:hypothetical protein [uncultured Psychroserpens sp.]